MWSTRTVVGFKNGGSVDSTEFFHWTEPSKKSNNVFLQSFCTEPSTQKVKQFSGHTNKWLFGQLRWLLDLELGVLWVLQSFCAELSLQKSQTIFGAHQHVIAWSTRTTVGFKNGGSVHFTEFLFGTYPFKKSTIFGAHQQMILFSQLGQLLDLELGVLWVPQSFCTEPCFRKSQTIFGAHQQMIAWSTMTIVGFKNGGSLHSTEFLHWT